MFEFLGQALNKMYDDKKKLKTNTVLYGYLDEGRWHTHLQPPLPNEDIIRFEEESKREFPAEYKEFLSFNNGCYLFDILRIAGKDADTYKGLSIEEEGHLAFDLNTMDNLYRNKRTPTTHFIFADSLVKNAYYVIDSEMRILEIDVRTKKVINSYVDLKSFLNEILIEGKRNINDGIYYEFK
ncbi:SMI1/KNR4 family protein [Fictibacillus arsenicus]|uniref:Knr4/Smi1-like domain-containing protein n=1 Tax=Fictibacillus arsenicus TaxID=255247 RepID=A0A1V3G864_9BACL|nr:SMI1/KNR4 family protein [Fictibacillus arsenicus]OOE12572.1 hypothetical protein UN64_10890 [Fictibacillus arsenicus]